MEPNKAHHALPILRGERTTEKSLACLGLGTLDQILVHAGLWNALCVDFTVFCGTRRPRKKPPHFF